DPAELAGSAAAAIAAALGDAGASESDVAALGIANQTETFLIADRRTGRPIHPAIVWQDRRTADACAALQAAGQAPLVRSRTGLELDATFPATKIGWVLDHVDGARGAAEAGELVYCDVAAWLLWSLTGSWACDLGNAARTLLCPLGGADWDDELLELFGVPRALLPPIVDSDALAQVGSAGAGRPGLAVTGALGDQQASLFGLGCRTAGSAKVTLGTGAFILAQAGSTAPEPPAGVLASCAWRLRSESSFALEGFVPAAGAALDWLATVGLLPPGPELDDLLATAGPEDHSVAFVPALQGLGTPTWDASIRGSLLGLSRATTRAQVARAAVDGVLHQVVDALEAIGQAMAPATVLVDGGLSRCTWIVQRLADLAEIEVRRAARSEATAIGAAMLAGLAAGFWADEEELPPLAVDRIAHPSLQASVRASLRERWAEAVTVAAGWRP
ncbi:MAG: FGGY family carbohydrate kinase, partial [Solirubrobacteraceae bacterium]